MLFIKKQIKKFHKIIIHGHINPDGDCYGSQFGLKHIIQSTFPEKQIFVVGEKNNSLSFIGEIDEVSDVLYQDSLVFVLDSGSKNVVSDKRFSLSKNVIWIDHHIQTTEIYNECYSWIDSSFSSCSEMIFVLKEKLNMKLNLAGALAIYTGILTDSNGFKYERVNSKTFLIVSELLKYGLDISYINNKIYSENVNLLKYKSYCLSNFKIDQGFAYINISKNILETFKLNYQKVFSVVSLFENLEDVYVWALFVEQDNSKIKVSIRSKGPDIYSIAKKFLGGGHSNACGVLLHSEQDYLIFLEEIKKSINTFLQNNFIK